MFTYQLNVYLSVQCLPFSSVFTFQFSVYLSVQCLPFSSVFTSQFRVYLSVQCLYTPSRLFHSTSLPLSSPLFPSLSLSLCLFPSVSLFSLSLCPAPPQYSFPLYFPHLSPCLSLFICMYIALCLTLCFSLTQDLLLLYPSPFYVVLPPVSSPLSLAQSFLLPLFLSSSIYSPLFSLYLPRSVSSYIIHFVCHFLSFSLLSLLLLSPFVLLIFLFFLTLSLFPSVESWLHPC